ncbi:MAG: helix-turn-helix transcriptional regulator [Acidobacteria bacterium]|nr:helix-turn-helix transcriptional regulator [Acidobacteriota bacterium]
MEVGEKLKEIRNRLGITMREIEEYSQRIAEAEGNDEFFLSSARLFQIENQESTPSIYKLYSLSIIYRIKFTDLLSHYGVELEKIAKYQLATPLEKTHLTNLEVYDRDQAISFPVQFDPGFSLEKTNLISRMVQTWGQVPIALIQRLDFRRSLYGYIGLKDYTLYPILRPGSFVQIDNKLTKIQKPPWRTEFERPIYFVELHDGYVCSWCELQGKQLILVPHPLSGSMIRQFAYPNEAEIVGRVTAVAMRIVTYAEATPDDLPKLSTQS